MTLSNIDLTREFEFEHNRCQNYFDYMYRTLQFSFAAIIAIVGIGFAFFENEKGQNNYNYISIIFAYVLPVCMYVFGVLYAYNTYALAICGQKAELIHSKIYNILNINDDISLVLKNYVISNRIIAALSYGVPLGFYLATPAVSIIFSMMECKGEKDLFFHYVLPGILFTIYLVIMLLILISLCKHFAIKRSRKIKYTEIKKDVKTDN